MKIFYQLDLTNYNSYRISSRCKIAYFPENENDTIDFIKEYKDFIILGSGHNIIFSKDYYDTPIMIFNGNFNKISLSADQVIEVEAGAMMSDVAEFALFNGLSGVEIFWDIPSSLGGAVVMNAGASGEEIKDVLVKVRYLDLKDMEIKEISTDNIEFSYRNSIFQRSQNKIVLKAWLKLKPGDSNEIKLKMENIKSQRWDKQPRDFPNCGSVFKRPKGYYVGQIISELDLKGYSIGGAKISEKHGGFIINYNKAKGADIIALINHVRQIVLDQYGIVLEIEQRII